MKIKITKIRSVDKNICSKEQLFAYNMAQRYASIDVYEYHIMSKSQLQKSDVIRLRINYIVSLADKLNNEIKGSINPDAVKIALNMGLEQYIKCYAPIMASYKEIGKMFSIPYEVI